MTEREQASDQGPSDEPSEDGKASGSTAGPGTPRPPSPPSPQGFFVRTSLVVYGVMGCAALLWRMAWQGESILYPGAGPAEGTWAWPSALLAGAAIGGLAVGSSELMTRFTQLGAALADLLGEGLAGLSRGDAWLLALASGLAEEMLFRGAVQPAFGLIAASLLFGVCHFLPRPELALWSLWAVVIGLAFGLLFELTGHLAAPVAAHVVVNGINLPRLARRSAEENAAAARKS